MYKVGYRWYEGGLFLKFGCRCRGGGGEAEGQCDKMRAWCQCLLLLQLSCAVLPMDQQTGK